MRKKENTTPTPVDEFREEYKIHPRLMYWLFIFYGMKRNTASRAVNILWDDCKHESDLKLCKENPKAYYERGNRWATRKELYLNHG